MAEQVTTMVIKVDLQCYRCFKKIKKVLCGIPQIRDQRYDEKNNTVTITVVCCSPEKIKQKISYKGGKSIKGIEIKEPPKPKPPEKPKEPEKPKPKPVGTPKEEEKPKLPRETIDPEKKKVVEKGKEETKKAEKPEPEKPKVLEKPPKPPTPGPIPVVLVGTQPPYPMGVWCRECYEAGYPWGPCFLGHARPPPPFYEAYGRPVYDSWGGGNPPSREYFSEENPSACTIM